MLRASLMASLWFAHPATTTAIINKIIRFINRFSMGRRLTSENWPNKSGTMMGFSEAAEWDAPLALVQPSASGTASVSRWESVLV